MHNDNLMPGESRYEDHAGRYHPGATYRGETP